MNESFVRLHWFYRSLAAMAATFIAAVLWVGLHCDSVRAQETLEKTPPKEGDMPAWITGPTTDEALAQLAAQIGGKKNDLQKMQEKYGEKHPNVVQAQNALDRDLKYLALLQKLTQLEKGRMDEHTKAQISQLRNELSEMTLNELLKRPESNLNATDSSADQMKSMALTLQQELGEKARLLAEREQQLAHLAEQLAVRERMRQLPPLEDAQVKMYSLDSLPARTTAETIESLLGTQSLRVAVDERTNTLIVFGKDNVLSVVDALVTRLGEQAAPREKQRSKPIVAAEESRSLLLRVFWLADGLPEGEGQDALYYLPESVLAATNKLGVKNARIVTQTVNSLAVGGKDAVSFSTNVPAILAKQQAVLNCSGEIKMIDIDRTSLQMNIQVGGPIHCELTGSLATPLGHYMVLGTANAIIADAATMQAMAFQRGEMMGRGGPEFGRGRGEFGPQQPGLPGVATEEAAPNDPPKEPKYSTSRFAFVVQVIEGESYPAEKVD